MHFNTTSKRARLILPCCHTFCSECFDIEKSLRNRCPNCAGPITNSQINWYVDNLATNITEKKRELIRLIDVQKEMENKIRSSKITSHYLTSTNKQRVNMKYSEFIQDLQVLKNNQVYHFFTKYGRMFDGLDICIKKIRNIIDEHSDSRYIRPLSESKKFLYWDFNHCICTVNELMSYILYKNLDLSIINEDNLAQNIEITGQQNRAIAEKIKTFEIMVIEFCFFNYK